MNKQYAIHRTVRQEVVDDTKYVCFYAAITVYYKSFLGKENLNSIPLSWKQNKPYGKDDHKKYFKCIVYRSPE